MDSSDPKSNERRQGRPAPEVNRHYPDRLGQPKRLPPNFLQFLCTRIRTQIVPYSLHSNFREMEMLVAWMRPKRLIPIVREGEDKSTKFRERIATYETYLYSLSFMKQRGL